jgi:cytosine/creatinine deaminase
VIRSATAFSGVAWPDGSIGELLVEDGLIAAAGGPAPVSSVDCRGLVVLPRLSDPHVHLDKTFVGGAWHPHEPAADLRGRIRQELDALHRETERSVAARARSLADLLLEKGSTLIRSHVDISSNVGLSRLEEVLKVREDVASTTDIVLVAFPQEGIIATPGTAEVLEEALKLGVDAVGGLDPDTFDGDREAHLEVVFALATRYGRRIDIHLHETGISGLETMRSIAARTSAEGLEGKVCISHGFALATAPEKEVDRTIESLSISGVGLITSVPGRGLLPPIDRLIDAGVRVAVGSDNIRDSWSPFGRGDQLDRAALAAYQMDWRQDDELERALDLVTVSPGELLGAAPARLRPGDAADFVLVKASCAAEALVTAPTARAIYRRGAQVAGPKLAEVAAT